MSEDKSVEFQHGDKSYGTYTMKEDPAAIPKDKELTEEMIGVEIRNGDKLLFRGGVWDAGDFYWLYNEDGTLDSLGITVYTSYGVEYDANGNTIDRMEPSDWEIAQRYIAWSAMTIATLVLFIIGLQWLYIVVKLYI